MAVHAAQAAYLVFTSGSTGRPKAVVGTHAATVVRLEWMWAAHPYRPGERACARAAPVFVDAVAELYGPLLAGVPVELVPTDAGADPERLAGLVHRAGITRLVVVPAMLGALLRCWSGAGPSPALTLCVSSGEPLPLVLVDRFADAAPSAQLLNLYGSTEVAGDATASLTRPGVPPALGTAITGARTSVRDRWGMPVAELGVGELHIGGQLVSRGYHADPARTAERFLPDPDGCPGTRAFRTGDMVRCGDADLHYVGRIDAQVKVRGIRVEPGEVEATLLQHPLVRDVAVGPRNVDGLTTGLVARVVPVDGAADGQLATDLRSHAAARLPAALVPLIQLANGPLPRTATGKLDRRALESFEPATAPGNLLVPLDGPVEHAVAAAFDAVLPHRCLSAHDDFFSLGGHSLMAADLVRRIADDLGVTLGVRDLFQAGSVREVAGKIARGTAAPAADPSALVARPQDWYLPFPLTPVQLAYWIGRDRSLRLGGVATHAYLEIAVEDIDLARLEQAIGALVVRHASLRTVVLPHGEQQVLQTVDPYRVRVTDPDDGRWQETVDHTRAQMSHQVLPADTWPLFDVRVTRRKHGVSRLHVSVDALIADAHSTALLTEELSLLYRRPHLRLPPLGITFRDVVMAQQGSSGPGDARHWQERASNLPDAPDLPVREDDGGVVPTFRRRSDGIPTRRWRALQSRAGQAGVTPTIVLLAAYAEVLRRWARSPRFTLVLTLFHRPGTHPDLHHVVGDFTALVPLDVTRARRSTFAGYARELQLRLGSELDGDPAGGVAVLRQRAAGGRGFPVVFTSTLGLPGSDEVTGGADALGETVHGVSQTPQAHLDHQVGEGPDGLVLNWDAVDAQFPPGMLDEMLAAYVGLLDELVDDPDSWQRPVASLLRQRAEPEPPTPRAGGPTPTLSELVRAAATAGPDRVAVVAGGVQITYREIILRAESAARHLLGHGIRRGELVGVAAAKGWPQVVAVLAITHAGAGYVPLDPDLPAARLQLLLEQTGARHVVVDTGAVDKLRVVPAVGSGTVLLHDLEHPAEVVASPAASPSTTAQVGVRSDRELAYVIFTSGSTGAPKGVMIDHRGAVNTVTDVNRRFGVDDRDRVLGLSALSFDLSVWDVFGTLSAGACLVLPDPGRSHDPAHWLRTAARGGVTIWNSVPALLGLAVERTELTAAPGLSTLRLVLLSGDWIPVDLSTRLRALAPDATVIGLGGATEASIWSVHHRTGDDPADGLEWTSVPYGRPLTHQWLDVFDADCRTRPVWSAGELVIGGRGLALGYWREPGLTAGRFVASQRHTAQGAGTRAYRTGDVARFRPGAVLEFLGRDDAQVKINGFRVELTEIDSSLLSLDGVGQAAAVVTGPARGDRRLAAAVVPRIGHHIEPDVIRSRLSALLPAHQVPRRILVVDAIPLGVNGKVDRRALADQLVAAERGRPTLAPPPARAPAALIDNLRLMWAEVLGVEEVGPHENFFALGGTSLVAVRLLALLTDTYRVRLSMTRLLERPTVAQLAEAVDDARRGPQPAAAPIVASWTASPDERFDPFPLTEVQQAYWVGRRPGLSLGGVATHSYVELDVADLDVARLEGALRALISRHDALRTVVRPDGTQQVLAEVPDYRLTREGDHPDHALELRTRMSHQVQDPGHWPLFEVAVSRPRQGIARLHISIDLLVADAWSFQTLQRELLALYHGTALGRPAGCSFRDYVLAVRRSREAESHRRDRSYWAARIGDLPGPPALPRQMIEDGSTRFERLTHRWDDDTWARLRTAAAQRRLTPSGVLCAALAEVIAMWSQSPRFLLNLTTFHREPVHPDVNEVVGDFTTTTILAVDASASTFAARATALQGQIFRDLEHRSFSGVDVLRLLRRDPSRRFEAQAPVVFTSMLMPESGTVPSPPTWNAEVAFAVSQTPQVRLDVQISEHAGELYVTWDHLQGAFPPGLIQAMFDGYTRVINAVAGSAHPALDYWEVGPAWTS